jgi:hypothetical protein
VNQKTKAEIVVRSGVYSAGWATTTAPLCALGMDTHRPIASTTN